MVSYSDILASPIVFGHWERVKSDMGFPSWALSTRKIPVHPLTGRWHVEAEGCRNLLRSSHLNVKSSTRSCLVYCQSFHGFIASQLIVPPQAPTSISVVMALCQTLSLALYLGEFHVYRTDFFTGGSGTPRPKFYSLNGQITRIDSLECILASNQWDAIWVNSSLLKTQTRRKASRGS